MTGLCASWRARDVSDDLAEALHWSLDGFDTADEEDMSLLGSFSTEITGSSLSPGAMLGGAIRDYGKR